MTCLFGSCSFASGSSDHDVGITPASSEVAQARATVAQIADTFIFISASVSVGFVVFRFFGFSFASTGHACELSATISEQVR